MKSAPSIGPPIVETTVEQDESIVNEITESVAALTNSSIVDLPALNESIDADAIQTLFSAPRSDGFVSFTYHGLEVRVHSDGTLEIFETEVVGRSQ